ncbi:DNA primase, partial [Patescibacteria group bacterium]
MAENQVSQVKQKADIVSVIDSRIKLQKSGRNLKAVCPFHGEKTPSFFVSPEIQTFKCFGCGEGGDVFTFLQKYEGMNFPESLEYLANKVGVKLKSDFRTGDEQKRKRLLEILHLTEEYYHFLLIEHKIGRRALNYLKKRGIGKILIKQFKLGYSLDSWDELQKYLVRKKKYEIGELEKVGLVIRSTRGGYYDRFRGRVMFPLKDIQGKTLGFSGRVLPGEGVNEKEAKYINSPETQLYHKSQMLYGLFEVRSDIKRKDFIVVTEGELDMVSSFKAGVRNVVAVKGSALTQDQVGLIRRLTTNIVLALDADDAGTEATRRGIEVADSLGMNLSVVEVTEGKDPDDLARNDPEGWKKLVLKPESVYDYLIRKALEKQDVSTGPGKKAVSKDLAPLLAKISNAVERDHYVKQVSEKLGVSRRVFEEEVIKAEKIGKTSSTSKKVVSSDKKLSRRERLEQ